MKTLCAKMAIWNIDRPNEIPYTKQEHQAAGPSAHDMAVWNIVYPPQERYTQQEHQAAGPSEQDKAEWNDTVMDEDEGVYTIC